MYSYNENVELPNIICLLNAFDNLRVPLHLKKHKPLCITIALWKAIVFYCCSKYTIVWSHTFRFSDFCIKKILSTYKIWDLNPYISIKKAWSRVSYLCFLNGNKYQLWCTCDPLFIFATPLLILRPLKKVYLIFASVVLLSLL